MLWIHTDKCGKTEKYALKRKKNSNKVISIKLQNLPIETNTLNHLFTLQK